LIFCNKNSSKKCLGQRVKHPKTLGKIMVDSLGRTPAALALERGVEKRKKHN
jgi:hypothetical protein